MTQFEQEQAAKRFAEIWKDKGSERSEAQKFWIQLLREVYGVQNSEQYIDFELPVKIKNTSFADGFIADTKVLIEMKGKDVDLDKKEKQSDESELTPFQQAKRYADELVYEKGVRWIIVSNFKEIRIYDMKKRHSEPEILKLSDLPKYYYVLQILVNDKDENIKKEEHISKKAGDIIGKLYDEIKPLYQNPNDDETLQSLNKLCVRIVFCLYAEDAGLFGNRLMFHDYINDYKSEDVREALISLFDVLNTPNENRDPYLKEELKAFPYVNGGLFEGKIEIPRLNEKVKNMLLEKASEDFDWTEISPTIFGGLFESTLNQETRRSGGMHYTSVENIRKVIKPLFLDELQYEFEKIKAEPIIKNKKQQLEEFQNKISKLIFFDPACGSGNFLTQTFIELREIENELIKELIRIDRKQYDNQIQLGIHIANPIKVSITQFYGLEINDFAVAVAKTALWIAEHQMFEKTRSITFMKDEFLPLKTYTNIVEGDALITDWNTIVDSSRCNYIMGNPPFSGAANMSKAQKNEMFEVFKDISKAGDLDFVSAWYEKAAGYSINNQILCAFVSTNSITQGEQPAILWNHLHKKYNLTINFAYKTFIWDSEASLKAHVHCVIIGFSTFENHKKKLLFEENNCKPVEKINGYLLEADNTYVETLPKPLSNITKMIRGSSPCDNGNYSFTEEEKEKFIKDNPTLAKYIKPYIGSREFINRKNRYCLWLYNADPVDLRNSKSLPEMIEKVKKFRLESKKEATNKLAETPLLWEANRYNGKDYILIPRVSSSNRKYIPIGFIEGNVVANDACQLVPNATLYDFGILTSNVHNAWIKVVAGRLKSDIRYSNLVYNSFVFPKVTDEQKNKIEKTAQHILDVRAEFPNSSLADLYDENYMPEKLKQAHQINDMAVMEAYGFDRKTMSEDDCVSELMKMYQQLVK